MSSQPKPETATDGEGNEYSVFMNPYIEGRYFIEVSTEESDDSRFDGMQKYRGRTTGGEINGTTGSDYLTFAPTVEVTTFVDITDAGMTYTYA